MFNNHLTPAELDAIKKISLSSEKINLRRKVQTFGIMKKKTLQPVDRDTLEDEGDAGNFESEARDGRK